MAEFILRKLNQLKSSIDLRFAVITIALCSLSYVFSCYRHTSPSTAGLLASSLFPSDSDCPNTIFHESNSLLDFASHHSADILLASSAPIPQPLPPIPPPPPTPPYPQPQGSLHGERGGAEMPDSDSLRVVNDVVPVATVKPGRRLLCRLDT